jgi:hypothetical protein
MNEYIPECMNGFIYSFSIITLESSTTSNFEKGPESPIVDVGIAAVKVVAKLPVKAKKAPRKYKKAPGAPKRFRSGTFLSFFMRICGMA